LDDDGNPGTDIYALWAGLKDGSYNLVVKEAPVYNQLVTGLAQGAKQKWGLKIYMPTTISDPEDCDNMSATVTLVASVS